MRACCPADWLPLCCLCRLHAAAVWSLSSVPQLFVCFFLFLFFVGWVLPVLDVMSPHSNISVNQPLPVVLLEHFVLASPSHVVSFVTKCANTFQPVAFAARFLCECCLPKERSTFPLLTLSLCRWMSCSSPGCLPLTPPANRQLLLHTADSWRAKRCLSFPSDICTAQTFTTGVNQLIQIQFMS